MNHLFITRSNIANIIILINLMLYCFFEEKKKNDYKLGPYARLVTMSLGHCFFGLITEITVNIPDFPVWLNNIFHFIFVAFGLFFAMEYLYYTLCLLMPFRKLKSVTTTMQIATVIALIQLAFFGFEYKTGQGTSYSTGTGVFICYAIIVLSLITSGILVLVYRKQLDSLAVSVIAPSSALSLFFLALQMFIPEFLFSGNMTLIVVFNLFFTCENPISKEKQRSYMDYLTGLYNRNCYENDYNKQWKNDMPTPYACVMCDLNDLKTINDVYGHETGDKAIVLAAQLLQHALKNAYKIYRIGGDEFAAIYLEDSVGNVAGDIQNLEQRSTLTYKTTTFTIELAVGYVTAEEGEAFEDCMNRADKLMYQNKAALKSSR